MKRGDTKTRAAMAGLTLVELLVAMAVMTTLGVLTYRATTEALETYAQLNRINERWAAIVRAVHLIETELMQQVRDARVVLTRPGQGGAEADPEALTELSILTMGQEAGPERVAFVLRGGALYWVRSPLVDPVLVQSDLLLDDIESLRWALLGREGWVSEWHQTQPPAAVRLSLSLRGLGEFERVIAFP